MTVWDTFFMMLMVIPVSKMLSSIFMKLIARIGTIDEEKYAAMGMGTIMTVAAIAGVGKNKIGKLAGGGARAGGGSGGSDGAGMVGLGATTNAGLGVSGNSGPAGPSSAAADFLGVDSGSEVGAGANPGTGVGIFAEPMRGEEAGFSGQGATASTRLGAGADVGAGLGATGGNGLGTTPIGGETPLDSISQKAGEIGDKTAVYGAYAGSLAPVAAPVVAGIMAFTTKAMVGPAVVTHGVTKNLKEGFRGHREGGMGRSEALSRSAMDLTGASSASEASARILGSVLGSPFGGSGSKTGANALGTTVRFVNDKSAWIKDKVI